MDVAVADLVGRHADESSTADELDAEVTVDAHEPFGREIGRVRERGSRCNAIASLQHGGVAGVIDDDAQRVIIERLDREGSARRPEIDVPVARKRAGVVELDRDEVQ